METKTEHLIVRQIKMVDVRDWEGLGAFNCGEPEERKPVPGDTRQNPLYPIDGPLAVQALVIAEYGPAGIKPRPTDGMTVHMLTHPDRAPKIGEILRITIESMPEGGWPEWNYGDGEQTRNRELVEKDVDLALPGGRRTSQSI